MIESLASGVLNEADGGCSVSLRVAINEKSRLFRGGQTSGQINGGCGFADTALLVCTSDDSCQMFPRRKLSKGFAYLQVVSRGKSDRMKSIQNGHMDFPF